MQEEIEALEAQLAEARSAAAAATATAQSAVIAPASPGTMLGKEALGLMGEFETVETVLAMVSTQATCHWL